jgi:hypothetical protein
MRRLSTVPEPARSFIQWLVVWVKVLRTARQAPAVARSARGIADHALTPPSGPNDDYVNRSTDLGRN